jgi:hypothetical protein
MTLQTIQQIELCECGCGSKSKVGNRYIHGHYNKIPLPFDKAREIARSLNLNSEIGYRKLKREGKLPKELPGHPDRAYKNRGWISWHDFLKYEPPNKPLSFDEAKEIIRRLGIKRKDNYLRLYKERKLPNGLPSDPPRRYKTKGWISWTDYFGSEPYRIKALEFEKAKEIVRDLGIKNTTEYQELFKRGKLPKGMPLHPERTYKNKGWVNWYVYLNNELPTKPLPFKEAVKIVRKLGIKGKEEYQRLHKEGKLPKGLPYEPQNIYSKERMNR